MNIKINVYAHDLLQEHILDTIQFGNPNGEDTDLLHIVHPNIQMDSTIIDNNHTLFYKDTESNTDHLYTTPRGYVQGVITGSNTLFYELLADGLLKGTCLEFLVDYEKEFITYKLLKGFIGCAKRDFIQAESHKDPDKKYKWSLVSYNLVRKHSGYATVSLDKLDLVGIKLVRSNLGEELRTGKILFSVSDVVYSQIQGKLFKMKNIDIQDLNNVSLFYYDTWRE